MTCSNGQALELYPDRLGNGPARSARCVAVEQRAQRLVQLCLFARKTGGFARSTRRLDLCGTEDLQLEQRGPRVARSADIRRVAKRVLAARAAQ